ncbi:nucleotide-diphospho-sugar transferase [Lasiosphaeria miniovina]|uniref:Nucleotide-diphospho-sugar transferase n=1 Tax=Lasiosphaeria miniovina TaxID=1954250 RepID=A0AA40AL44_9PEZI|nr:nucleotide-diphospho-sugar transferase [Lasiosphaeria miniovina]KAK0717856.1 nucleotide-diphospho-sugar transferase [Lasiosphaeria miniovina]
MGEALSRKAKYLVLALPLVFTFLYLTRDYHSYGPPRVTPYPYQGQGPYKTKGTHATGATVSSWWIEFFSRLDAAHPNAAPVQIDGRAPNKNFPPPPDYERPDMLVLTATDEANMRASHAAYMSELAEFSRHLPYRRNTNGIVTTAGAKNFGTVVPMVLALRQTGSRLPVEIVVDSSAPWVRTLCAEVLAPRNATCIFIEDVWAGLDPQPKLERFQWKFISIVASSFQNVLFLDADVIPVHSPDSILAPGSQPFASTGFITWPDFWAAGHTRLFYAIAGDVEVPLVGARTTSESGIMAYDKARHADTLLLASYYNYYGPDFFYAMMTQHGPGEGDKETFFQAALVLEGLGKKPYGYVPPMGWTQNANGNKKGYWDVKKLPHSHGRTVKGNWRGMLMLQMDPMEDYRAVMAAIEKDKHKEPELPAAQPTSDNAAASDGDNATFFTDSSFLGNISHLKFEQEPKRWMFFHHNGCKLDFTRIDEEKAAIVATDDDGKFMRLWGNPDWIIGNTGRDVEKELWRDSMEVWCLVAEFDTVCDKMREIYAQVY